MQDDESCEGELSLPQYRVRLFLSADLAGSTAFKSEAENHIWATEFRKFYSGFLGLFESNFLKTCREFPVTCGSFTDGGPKLWKTIGDEVIFVNRVDSSVQVFAFIHAFVETLKDYRKSLKGGEETKKLDIKGNGWIASFPHPNQTFELPSRNHKSDDTLPNENLELGADENPHLFDFLGKGIDYGFRIGKNSRPDFFTISPALAAILCMANTNRNVTPFEFLLKHSGMNQLKGVLNGEEYPIVGLNTESDSARRHLSDLQDSLLGTSGPDPQKLQDYFNEFIKVHGIEMPTIKFKANDQVSNDPKYYTDYCKEWETQKDALLRRRENEQESASENGGKIDEGAVQEKTASLGDLIPSSE